VGSDELGLSPKETGRRFADNTNIGGLRKKKQGGSAEKLEAGSKMVQQFH